MCQRSCFKPSSGNTAVLTGPVSQKRLEVRMRGGDMATWAISGSLSLVLVPSAHPDQTDSVDPRAGSPVTKQAMCAFTGGQSRPKGQAHCLLCSGTMEGGDGGVCLKVEKSTDRKFKLWIDWTFIKRETILSHSHLSGNASFLFSF